MKERVTLILFEKLRLFPFAGVGIFKSNRVKFFCFLLLFPFVFPSGGEVLSRFDLSFPVRLYLKTPVLPDPFILPAQAGIVRSLTFREHEPTVIPAQAGVVSTHRSAPRDSRLRGTDGMNGDDGLSGNDGMNENENKKFALKNRNFKIKPIPSFKEHSVERRGARDLGFADTPLAGKEGGEYNLLVSEARQTAGAGNIRRHQRAKMRRKARKTLQPQYESCQGTDLSSLQDPGGSKGDTQAGFCITCGVKSLLGFDGSQALQETGAVLKAEVFESKAPETEKIFREKLQKRVIGQVSAKLFQTQKLRACLKGDKEWFKRQSPGVDWGLMKAVCEKQTEELKSSVKDRWKDMRISLALASANPDQIATGNPDLSFPLSHAVSGFSSIPKLTDNERRRAKGRWAGRLSETRLNGYSSRDFRNRFLEGRPLRKLTTEDLENLRQATWDLNRDSRDRYFQTVSEMPVLGYLKTGNPDDGDLDQAFQKIEKNLKSFLKKLEDPNVDMGLLLSFKPLVEDLLKENGEYCLSAERARIEEEREEKFKDRALLVLGGVSAVPCFITGPIGASLCLAGGLGLGAVGYRQAQTARDEALGRALTGKEFETIGGLKEKEREVFLARVFLPLSAYGTTAVPARATGDVLARAIKDARAGKTKKPVPEKNLPANQTNSSNKTKNIFISDREKNRATSENKQKPAGKDRLPSPESVYDEPNRMSQPGFFFSERDVGGSLLKKIGAKNITIQRTEGVVEHEFPTIVFKADEDKIPNTDLYSRSAVRNLGPRIRPAHHYKVSFKKSNSEKIELDLVIPLKEGNIADEDSLERIKQTLSEMPEEVFKGNLKRIHVNRLELDNSHGKYEIPLAQTHKDKDKGEIEFVLEDLQSSLPPKYIRRTMAHELGHVLALKKYGGELHGKDWEAAMAKDGPRAVTKYAEGSSSEDFAEAVWLYIRTDGGLRHPGILKRLANRFEIIDDLLNVDPAVKKAMLNDLKISMAARGVFWTTTLTAGGAVEITTAVVEDGEMTIYY